MTCKKTVLHNPGICVTTATLLCYLKITSVHIQHQAHCKPSHHFTAAVWFHFYFTSLSRTQPCKTGYREPSNPLPKSPMNSPTISSMLQRKSAAVWQPYFLNFNFQHLTSGELPDTCNLKTSQLQIAAWNVCFKGHSTRTH